MTGSLLCLDDEIGRDCLGCGSYADYYRGDKSVWWCHNKRCEHWNTCYSDHRGSKPHTKRDLLNDLIKKKGFCQCRTPKIHTVPNYFLCVNDNCFKVLRTFRGSSL